MSVFTDHPATAGQTYLEHQAFAASIGMRLLGAGAAALVHAVFPFLFVTTAGRSIDRLHDELHRRAHTTHQSTGAGVVP